MNPAILAGGAEIHPSENRGLAKANGRSQGKTNFWLNRIPDAKTQEATS